MGRFSRSRQKRKKKKERAAKKQWGPGHVVISAPGGDLKSVNARLERWEALREALEPEMTTFEKANHLLEGREHLYDWLQDLDMALLNAGASDGEYAEKGVLLCETVLSQFTEAKSVFLTPFRQDLGEHLANAGRWEDAEAQFSSLIESMPDRTVGYLGMASLLTREEGPGYDPARAAQYLKRALDRPVKDAGDYELKEQYKALMQEVGAD